MSNLSLLLLGSPQIERDGVLVAFDTRKAIALLAYLTVTSQSHTRDALAALLWPESDRSHARAALRSTLWTINQALRVECLDIDRETIGLCCNADLWIDVAEFGSRLAECQTHGHLADEACPACLAPLNEAIRLYRGDFMAGFTLNDSPGFDDWQCLQTESLRCQLVGALERLAYYHTRRQEFEPAIACTRRWLSLEPAHEPAHRLLMQLYGRTGRCAAALRQYQECVQVLEQELGASPQAETTQLSQAIRDHSISPFVQTSHPPLRGFHNLPQQSTPFIGRQNQVAEIIRLLDNPTCRLLTLVGPGGVGKTRLALQVATESLDRFADGVYYVALSSVTDPALVAVAIAQALGVKETRDQSLVERLKTTLYERQVLLLLDNFEHVIASATFVSELLAACQRLKVLATSRQTLHLYGEHEFRVPPLKVPDARLHCAEEALRYDAIRLFVERAQAGKSDFQITLQNAEAVTDICTRLDGLPLAIELAAAQIKIFSPQALLARLTHCLESLTGGARDVPVRQQTLRNTIAWGYGLLDGGERMLFTRLAVFIGGCTVMAADAVCNAAGDLPVPVLDGLVALADKSLLQPDDGAEGEPRFRMLETIREYALEQLAVRGEKATLERQHAAYYVAFVEQAEQELQKSGQVEWLERLEREHDNLRAALDWAIACGEAEIGLRLSGSLWRFWSVRSYFSEGRQWLGAALGINGDVSLPVCAKALKGAGALAWHQGDWEQAIAFYKERLQLCREMDDKSGIASTLSDLAGVLFARGDLAPANSLMEESLALRRELGDPRDVACALNNLGLVALARGDCIRARASLEESLGLRRGEGNKFSVASTVNDLGRVALAQGDVLQAHKLMNESLALRQELGDKQGIAYCLEGLAGVAIAQKQMDRAVLLCGAAEALRQVIGAPLLPCEYADYERTVASARAHLDEAAFVAAWAEGRVMPLERVIVYALDHKISAESIRSKDSRQIHLIGPEINCTIRPERRITQQRKRVEEIEVLAGGG